MVATNGAFCCLDSVLETSRQAWSRIWVAERGRSSGAGLGCLISVGLELVATLIRTGCEFFFSESMPVDWFCIVILPSSACRILDGKKGVV